MSQGRKQLPSGAERARLVREMFDRISVRYELLNTLMTGGLDRHWSNTAVKATGLNPGGRALDLACGTGRLTRKLAKRVGPHGYVLGVDFSEGMLQSARERPLPNVEYRLGDATNLENVPSESFDTATIAYGARNIPDLEKLFSEMARCVRPGGTVVCLEIAQPTGKLYRAFYGIWFDKIVPSLGSLVSGDRRAYAYLPESVKEFVEPGELAGIIRSNELQDVTWRRLAGGVVTLHRGVRRHRAGWPGSPVLATR